MGDAVGGILKDSLGPLAGVVGGALGVNAANQAAQAQLEATRQANELQRDMFNQQVEWQKPFHETGVSGLNQLSHLLGLGGDKNAEGFGQYANANFGSEEFLNNRDPGYGFRMDEAMKALERGAAARGGLLSGNTLKATQRYGQDLASQEYQNAFDRYQTQRANTLNPLQSLAGVAQTSANALTQAAGNMGQSMSDNIIGGGNAQAAGYMGMSNALSNALGQGMNFYQNQQMISRLPQMF